MNSNSNLTQQLQSLLDNLVQSQSNVRNGVLLVEGPGWKWTGASGLANPELALPMLPEDQFNVDGTLPQFVMPAGGYQKLRHSLGLVATSAAASLMGTQQISWKFVDAVWNAKLEPYEDGYFDPYYDGLLYLFSLMHLSGNYKIITPEMDK